MYFSRHLRSVLHVIPQMRTKRLLFTWLLTLFFLTATFMPTRTVAAPQTVYDFASYELQVDFAGNRVNAKMIVHVKGRKDGIAFHYSTTTPVHCVASKGVEFRDAQAYFTSAQKGALQCDLPSFADIVYQMTNGKLKLERLCTCRDPYMLANIQLLYDPQWQGNPTTRNPLFYHPDVQFFVPYVDPPHVAVTRMEYNGSPLLESARYAVQPGLNAIWAGNDSDLLFDYADFEGWHNFLKQYNLSTLADSLYWTNGQRLNTHTTGSLFTATTDAVTVYIGFNPVTNTYLDGVIERIVVDPPHWGI